MRWSTPDCIWPTSGHAEGITELNAFDNALLNAGIGNLNLIKLSSIVPANVEILNGRPDIEAGALVPTVFTVEVERYARRRGCRRGGHRPA